MTDHSLRPTWLIGVWRRYRRRRRWIIGHAQRWQNLISACIALGAAIWAWQLTQQQIQVAQEQLRVTQGQANAAQKQASIAHVDMLSRRLGDVEFVRLQLAKLRSLIDSSELHPDLVMQVDIAVEAGSASSKLFAEQKEKLRTIIQISEDLQRMAARMQRTPALTEVTSLLNTTTLAGNQLSYFFEVLSEEMICARGLLRDAERRTIEPWAKDAKQQRSLVAERAPFVEAELAREAAMLAANLRQIEGTIR